MTKLLNDDGTASMATLMMCSHHAFRRDLASFMRALSPLVSSRASALREEWESFHGALHGHHMMEDANIFPAMRAEHAELAAAIDQLGVDHREIDPLLERGDRAFARLGVGTDDARAVIAELIALLDSHLEREEKAVIPHLRAANHFPPPPTDADAELYASGFAWSMHGIAPSVAARVIAILPAALTDRLPAAKAAYAARCERVWGTSATGESTDSVPGSR